MKSELHIHAIGKTEVTNIAEAQRMLEDWLATRLARLVTSEAGYAPEMSFRDMGISSLNIMAVVAEMSSAIGISLPTILPFDYPSPQSLCGHVAHLCIASPHSAGETASSSYSTEARGAYMDMSEDAAAVIGVGCRFPGGADGPDALWALLREGRDAIGPIPENRWSLASLYDSTPGLPGKMYTKEGGFLDDIDLFDAGFFGIAPREAKAMDPQQRLVLEVAAQALDAAGLDKKKLAGSKTGVFLGISGSDYGRMLFRCRDALDLYAGTGTAPSVAANRLSYILGLQGISIAVDTACSSSLVAVHLACASLRSGASSLALAGGVNLILSPEMNIIFSNARLMSPDGRCKTFDKNADGYVRSEGCGMVVLKRLGDALRDHDDIWGVILGSAVNQDGHSNGLTVPNGLAQRHLLREALADAGLAPHDIDYIEAHGTGTPVGDPIEYSALQAVFAPRPADEPLFIGSIKSNIGHMEQAAGIGGLVKVLLSLRHGELPPSLHFSEPNPLVNLEAIPAVLPTSPVDLSHKPVLTAGVSSFSFGGTNAHLIVRSVPERPAASEEPAPDVLLLSAHTPATLLQTIATAEKIFAATESRAAQLCRTARGKTHLPFRAAVTGTTTASFRERLHAVAQAKTGVGIHRGHAERPAMAGLAFTGQGAQYPGMGRLLYSLPTPYRDSLDRCFTAFEGLLPLSLQEVMHADAPGEEHPIHQTIYTQPALFALEYALASLWMDWGLEPVCLLGHSVGEYAAACIAGVFSLKDAARLVAARGRLIQELPAGGGMLALFCDAEAAERLIAPYPDLSVATRNGPANTVVSGPTATLKEAENAFSAKGVQAVRLRVSHAFHSPLMAPMLEEFRAVAQSVSYTTPGIPVVSNLTGAVAAGDDLIHPEYWVRHVMAPVRFYEGVRSAAELGISVMLEVGPHAVLTGLGRTMTDIPVRWTPSLLRAQDDRASLADATASLYTLGTPLHWERVAFGAPVYKAPLPTLAFEKKAYWFDRHSEEDAELTLPHSAASHDRAESAQPGVEAALPQHGATLVEHARTLLASVLQLESPEETAMDIPLINMGVDSLMAVQIKAGLDAYTQQDIPLTRILEACSLESLLRGLDDKAEQGAAPAENAAAVLVEDEAARFEPFALTGVQRAYWIGRQDDMELGGVGCRVYAELDLDSLDTARLDRAVQRLVDRHDMLRAIVQADGLQRVLPQQSYNLPVVDLTSLSAAETETRLAELRKELSHKAPSPDVWPLFDIRVSLAQGFVRLHISLDMLICDGMSMMILSRELEELYLNPNASLPPLGVRFRDYVINEEESRKTGDYESSRRYWLERLPTLPSGPDLPLAAQPRGIGAPVFVRRRGGLEPHQWEAFRRRASARGLTPSAALLSAFSRLLGMWSGSPKFCLNLTLFNRLPVHPDINGVVGDFTVLLLLETDTALPGSFAEFARAVQQRLWSDMEHRHFSAVDVLAHMRQEGAAAQTAMPVVFTSLLPLTERMGRASVFRPEHVPAREAYCISQTPQVWFDHQVYEDDGALRFNWDCVENLFPAGMLDAMLEGYTRLLSALAEDDSAWDERLPDMLPEDHVRRIAALNPSPRDVPDASLPALFHKAVLDRPDSPAILSPSATLTYRELDGESNAVGHALARSGAMPGDIIAVIMDKGWEQAAAVLGILKVGAAFLPIEADQPPSRMCKLLKKARCRIALTQPQHMEHLALPDEVRIMPVRRSEGSTPVGPPAGASAIGPNSLAYVIFTSGSTGVPKGVMQDHRSVANTILDINERFNVCREDVLLGLSNLNFDLAVYDLFGAFAAGAALALPAAQRRRDPAHWLNIIDKYGVTVWNSAPALMSMLTTFAEPGTASGKLRLILLSGDRIRPELPAEARGLFPNARVISLGGATEAAIWSIFHDATAHTPGMGNIPYGKPLHNQQMFVFNRQLQLCPPSATGNIFIGGVGLATGYLGDPEKTAASFIRHPESGERLYRTGDLGRYLPDGSIEFLGRDDFQVKIRGHRIELGEIEHALKSHPDIDDAVVTVSTEGAAQLHAYVLGSSAEGLREHVRSLLPEYMVPATFTVMKTFPLTPNGKLDRKALPRPQVRSTRARENAPMTQAEIALRDIWQEELRQNNIHVDDDFFGLGGDSLLAARIIARVRNELQASIPMNAVFATPTIRELAAFLTSDTKTDQPELPRVIPRQEAAYEPFPLTDVQHAYWIGRNAAFELGNVSAHFYYELDVVNLDADRLERAWTLVVQRHDMLRAVILPDGTQRVLERVPKYVVQRYPLAGKDARTQQAHLTAIRKEMSTQMLDVAAWPLFDIRVTELSGDLARIHIDFDNTIADAWSLFVLVQEWTRLYKNPASELPPLSITFRDYVLAERALRKDSRYEESKLYWEARLASLPPAPVLPLAQHPKDIGTPEFVRRSHRLSPDAWGALQRYAAARKLTPSGALLGAYATVLARWSAAPDFTINTTLFNRLPLHEEVNSIVGDFTSLNLLEVRHRAAASFTENARALQGQLWRDMDNRLFSGVEVMRGLQRLSETPGGAVMPVVFTSALMGATGPDASVLSGLGTMAYSIFQTPQVWLDHQVYEEHGSLVLNWDSIDALFPSGMLDDMFQTYVALLEALSAREERWEKSGLSLPAEQKARLAEMNDTGSNAEPQTLHGMFLKAAQTAAQRPAVYACDRTLTYAELEKEARAVAEAVAASGIAPQTPVAIAMERGWRQVAAVLGCLMAAHPYLPLAHPVPAERLRRIASDSGMSLLLTTRDLVDSYAAALPAGTAVLAADDFQETVNTPLPTATPDATAYIIYTSGSTGIPKGVAIAHKAAANTISAINSRYGVKKNDRLFALSSLSFDLSVYDIFGAFAASAAIVLPSEDGRNDPAHWAARIAATEPTIWNSAPALMQMFLTRLHARKQDFPACFRVALLSGDWIDRYMAAELRRNAPSMRLVSLGGATEASIWSVLHDIESVDFSMSSIPYGRPMPAQRMHVLNDAFEPCPEWTPGNLYIGGEGLAQGYWNDPEKTSLAFIANPRSGERLYKTGDIARRLPQGCLEFMGRSDQQIKIRGHRVEPGEIETALMESGMTAAALVIPAGADDASRKLVAFVTGDPADAVLPEALRKTLEPRLPRYMIPERVIVLESFPLSANGKIDRKRLPVPSLDDRRKPAPGGEGKLAETAGHSHEERLSGWFREILGTDSIQADSNFFDMGVTSFHLVQVQARLTEVIGREVPIIDFFMHPTIREFSAALAEDTDQDAEQGNAR